MNKFNVYTIEELKRKAEVSTSHPIAISFGSMPINYINFGLQVDTLCIHFFSGGVRYRKQK